MKRRKKKSVYDGIFGISVILPSHSKNKVRHIVYVIHFLMSGNFVSIAKFFANHPKVPSVCFSEKPSRVSRTRIPPLSLHTRRKKIPAPKIKSRVRKTFSLPSRPLHVDPRLNFALISMEFPSLLGQHLC